MKITHITLILLFITIFSCKEEESAIETEHLKKVTNSLKVSGNVHSIIILPGLGCKGCIQEVEMFMQENIENKDIVFVLTKIESLKILQAKIGIQLNDYENIVIDRNNEFVLKTNNTIYPCIITMENGKYVSHEFQSPQNLQGLNYLDGKVNL